MSAVTTDRSIVEEVLGRKMTREIWTGNYDMALPISIQDFDISAILPAVFFMFRFGRRRGKGKFLTVFAEKKETPAESRKSATIERVAAHLSHSPDLVGFKGETGQAILGDLLLSFCLENEKRARGRTSQIQRVAPVHYMSSWIDLPEKVVNLRYVPEMIVAMLANQDGDIVQASTKDEKTRFAVGRDFEHNTLLRAFHKGITQSGKVGRLGSQTSDQFDEEVHVGIDQLLMIRLAGQLGNAPDNLRGGEEANISNQRPIAGKAGEYFSEDIRRFLRGYADIIPRQSLVIMLESCIAIGLTTILASVIEILVGWKDTGEIQKPATQRPASFFIDCSNGVNHTLRALSEQSFDDFMRKVAMFPMILMALRLCDYKARNNSSIKNQMPHISQKPDATEWLNILGRILHGSHTEADYIFKTLQEQANELAAGLKEENPEAVEILENAAANPNTIWRLAEALTLLLGKTNTQDHINKCLDSCLMVDRPNGVASKRRTNQRDLLSTIKKRAVRSCIFTDSVQDYLVHLHLLSNGSIDSIRDLSLKEFIDKLRIRYGFFIDEAPPGMAISNDHLQVNRSILERRLRDLGLLSGVNDAEAMKKLKPRFIPCVESSNGID